MLECATCSTCTLQSCAADRHACLGLTAFQPLQRLPQLMVTHTVFNVSWNLTISPPVRAALPSEGAWHCSGADIESAAAMSSLSTALPTPPAEGDMWSTLEAWLVLSSSGLNSTTQLSLSHLCSSCRWTGRHRLQRSLCHQHAALPKGRSVAASGTRATAERYCLSPAADLWTLPAGQCWRWCR